MRTIAKSLSSILGDKNKIKKGLSHLLNEIQASYLRNKKEFQTNMFFFQNPFNINPPSRDKKKTLTVVRVFPIYLRLLN